MFPQLLRKEQQWFSEDLFKYVCLFLLDIELPSLIGVMFLESSVRL